MFELIGVSHRFGDRPVLRDVSLRLAERRVGVIGANGSGKSTLARLLNGLLLPERGRVLADGLDTRTDGREVRRRVGFVFADPDAQIVYPTVAEDLAFGLRARGLARDEIARRVEVVLRDYGLQALRDAPAHALSGGEKQLLAVCGVLVTDPRALVMDEPTTLLDLRNRRLLATVLAGLTQPAVVVTHDLDLVAGFDRVVVLDEGRVVADGAPDAAIAAYVALARP